MLIALWLYWSSDLFKLTPGFHTSLHVLICDSFTLFRFTADINDMKISYVLLDKSNATSDIFYFTVQDNGKKPLNYFILTCTDTSMEPWAGNHLPEGFLLQIFHLNGFLKTWSYLLSAMCLHHKDLGQLAMTDTRQRPTFSFHPTAKGGKQV